LGNPRNHQRRRPLSARDRELERYSSRRIVIVLERISIA
jgi:hypothetical protein